MTLSEFLQRHAAEHRIPDDLCQTVSDIAQTCIRIGSRVRQGALGGVLGEAGTGNIQGEAQKKLDVIANRMLIDALGLYGVFTAYMVKSWIVLVVLAALLLVVNWIYFSKRMIPAKYLVPGMVFLLIYQLFVMGYTGYVSLTNYGDGHNSTKADAIEVALSSNRQRVEGAPTVQTAVVEDGSELGLVVDAFLHG